MLVAHNSVIALVLPHQISLPSVMLLAVVLKMCSEVERHHRAKIKYSLPPFPLLTQILMHFAWWWQNKRTVWKCQTDVLICFVIFVKWWETKCVLCNSSLRTKYRLLLVNYDEWNRRIYEVSSTSTYPSHNVIWSEEKMLTRLQLTPRNANFDINWTKATALFFVARAWCPL